MLPDRPYSNRTRIRLAAALLGLVVGVALALWRAPSSHWLVRLQTALAVPTRLAEATPPELSPFATGGDVTPESAAAFRRAASDYPDDPMVQLAYVVRSMPSAFTDPPESSALGALAPFANRFPNSPALVAAILRHMAGTSVHIRRPELTRAPEKPGSQRGAPTTTADSPVDLDAFDRMAANGERLDPGNAFFPAMRAAGQFAAHNDAAARRSLVRAAALKHWDEYVADEVRGAWKLGDEALGQNNMLVHATTLGSASFSHYAVLRDTAKMASVLAVRQEARKEAREAAAFRLQVMAIGALVRVQSSTCSGSDTGSQIQEIALLKDIHGYRNHGKDVKFARREGFVGDLRANGFSANIPWVRAQFAARDEMRRTVSAGVDRFDITRGITTFGQWVVAGLVFLDSALWVLFFGLVAALLGRVMEAERMPVRLRVSWKTGVTASVVFIFALFWFLTARLTTTPKALLACVGAAVVGVFIWRMWSAGWRGLLDSIVAAVCTLPFAAALAAAVLWLGRGFAAVDALLSPNVAAAYSARDTAPGLAALGLAIAMVVAIGIAIAARARRESIFPGVVHGYVALALPIACALLLVYGGIAVNTARMGVAINRNLSKMVQHEGRFYADLAGKRWPE